VCRTRADRAGNRAHAPIFRSRRRRRRHGRGFSASWLKNRAKHGRMARRGQRRRIYVGKIEELRGAQLGRAYAEALEERPGHPGREKSRPRAASRRASNSRKSFPSTASRGGSSVTSRAGQKCRDPHERESWAPALPRRVQVTSTPGARRRGAKAKPRGLMWLIYRPGLPSSPGPSKGDLEPSSGHCFPPRFRVGVSCDPA